MLTSTSFIFDAFLAYKIFQKIFFRLSGYLGTLWVQVFPHTRLLPLSRYIFKGEKIKPRESWVFFSLSFSSPLLVLLSRNGVTATNTQTY